MPGTLWCQTNLLKPKHTAILSSTPSLGTFGVIYGCFQKQWYTKMDGYCLCVKGSKGPESVGVLLFFVFRQAFPKNQWHSYSQMMSKGWTLHHHRSERHYVWHSNYLGEPGNPFSAWDSYLLEVTQRSFGRVPIVSTSSPWVGGVWKPRVIL